MQYVRSLGGSVSKTWNSINPATLSGAIDVIVVEQEDGTFETIPPTVWGKKLTGLSRFSSMLTLPRPIRQILAASSIRKKGTSCLVYDRRSLTHSVRLSSRSTMESKTTL